MSHAVVMVALEGVELNEVEGAVEHQMAPFDENGEWFGDGSRWDWYQIGGRWTGYFALKPGVDPSTVMVGRPGLMTESPPYGRADVARKSDIDFAGMMDEAGARAGDLWTRVDAVVGARREGFRPWSEILEEHEGDLVRARDVYHGQPAVAAIKRAEDEVVRTLWTYDDLVTTPHDEYVDRAREAAIVPHAFLKDRVWNENGRMGWFGVTISNECQVGGEEPNVCLFEHEDGSKVMSWSDRWIERFCERFLNRLPDDTFLVAVDYHV